MTVVINQVVRQNNIIVLQPNIKLNQAVIIAEQQFAARAQAQLALANQQNIIQNNIRVNHFRNMFSKVNTVVQVVHNVVDVRDPANPNNRYLVNQLLADNGVQESMAVVMITAAETMTIGTNPTIEAPTATPVVGQPAQAVGDIPQSAPVVQGETQVTQIEQQLLNGGAAVPILQKYNSASPFGKVGQTVLLPFGTQPPTANLVFQDPAKIIFPNQAGLFVENSLTFAQDCKIFGQLGNTFVSSAIQVFPNFQQLAGSQTIVIGRAPPS